MTGTDLTEGREGHVHLDAGFAFPLFCEIASGFPIGVLFAHGP
jgi:hypothetical protein